MPRIESEERRLRQLHAHGEGVVGGDTGGAQLLQEDRFQIDQRVQRTGQEDDWLAGADPAAFLVVHFDIERNAARFCDSLEPLDHDTRRGNDRTAHEDRIGHLRVAELRHDVLGAGEVFVGPARHVRLAWNQVAVRLRMLCHVEAVPRGGRALAHYGARYCAAANLCTVPFRASFSDSATRKASSSDWLALRRGSQCVW